MTSVLELHMPKGVYKKSVEHGRALSAALQGNRNGEIHGASGRESRGPEYIAWQNMRARCNRPTHPRFYDYGGRGITVAPEFDYFPNFLAAVGLRPSSRHSLDRIDNEGNYEPGNVRWATTAEQAANKRVRRDRRA